MDNMPLHLSPENQAIMQSYFSLSDSLAELLGEYAEIVIHSLISLDNSVVKIVNGFHTGRKVGSPITDKGLQLLKDYQKNQQHSSACYFSTSLKGDLIKSTTHFIIGSSGEPIGLFCINLNLSYPLDKVLRAFTPNIAPHISTKNEIFSSNSQELIETSFDNAVAEVEKHTDLHSKLYKKAIVQCLFDKDIFELKDAVAYVAERLQLTKHAIYKHLREFKRH